MPKDLYRQELKSLHVELAKFQAWVQASGERIVVLFEGRDAAGKGGAIKRITAPLNPRVAHVVALGKPSDRERTQWYFQRYVPHLPAAGEMTLFDRSWYNRAVVERVMGFASEKQVEEFLTSCQDFERMLLRSEIRLVKYWFSVSPEEQERRFERRRRHPTKRWKLSDVDIRSRDLWREYSEAEAEMFARTEVREAPWYVIHSDDKRRARLNCIAHLLSLFDYEGHLPRAKKIPQRRRPPHRDVRPLVERQREIKPRY
ncbi:MAG: polyphosphate kinase 2 [Myxococcota bacterium]